MNKRNFNSLTFAFLLISFWACNKVNDGNNDNTQTSVTLSDLTINTDIIWNIYEVEVFTSDWDTTEKNWVNHKEFNIGFNDMHLQFKSDSTYNMGDSLASYLNIPKSGKIFFGDPKENGYGLIILGAEPFNITSYSPYGENGRKSWWMWLTVAQILNNGAKERRLFNIFVEAK